MKPKGTWLVLTQVYPPDPASVGQYMAEAAEELARRGWRVFVYTSNRGYDDPAERYPFRETRRGVVIRRLPLTSFGKKSITLRLLGQFSLVFQFILRGVFTRGLTGIFTTTIPTIAGLGALGVRAIRRVPIKYWVMDLNPDQAVALGMARPGSLSVKLFERLNRRILKTAADIVVLDRFMAERLLQKHSVPEKITVMPPWPMDDHLEKVPRRGNPFIKEHGLEDKFVVMYSGNHSISHPLDTLLEAALRLQDARRLIFLFIGGGLGKKTVNDFIARHRPRNMLSLPYQPLDKIKYSLSAADVHVVSMGNAMAGCVHPCKFYSSMALAIPFLLLGPARCHISEFIDSYRVGWRAGHGDVEGMEKLLREITAAGKNELDEMGRREREVVEKELKKELLCRRFCGILERGLD